MGFTEQVTNLIVEPGFWIQLCGLCFGAAIGAWIAVLIGRRQGTIFMAMPGFSLGFICLAMLALLGTDRGFPLWQDWFMALAWFLLATTLVLLAPWALLGLVIVIIAVFVFVNPYQRGFVKLAITRLADNSPLAIVETQTVGEKVTWTINRLPLGQQRQTETLITNDLSQYLDFDIVEFPALYRLVALPFYGRIYGLRPVGKAREVQSLGISAFPGVIFMERTSDLLVPGISRGHQSVVYLSGRVEQHQP